MRAAEASLSWASAWSGVRAVIARRLGVLRCHLGLMKTLVFHETRSGEEPDRDGAPARISGRSGRQAELADELGFSSAVTTRHGHLMAKHGSDRFMLPRISIKGSDCATSLVSAISRGQIGPSAPDRRGRT